jgi:hypothetical protein
MMQSRGELTHNDFEMEIGQGKGRNYCPLKILEISRAGLIDLYLGDNA